MNFNQLYKKIADLDEAFRRRNPDEDEEDFGHESDFEHDRRKDDERDRKREEQEEKAKSQKKTNEAAKWRTHPGAHTKDLDEAFRRRNPDEDEEDFGHESDFEHDRRKDDERDRKREEQEEKAKSQKQTEDYESEGSETKALSAEELADVFSKFQDGEITYDELRHILDSHNYDPRSKSSNADDDYTDYSMRQGEMGNPDARSYESANHDDYTMESIRRATKSTSLLKECGDDMMPAVGAAKSVTMNVTMNASSGEGIRELLGVLSNFESTTSGPEPMEMPMVMSTTSGHSLDKGPVSMSDSSEADSGDFEEDYANSPDEDYGTVDDVINPPSNDLNSPHKSYKNNPLGGDNKMAESIAQKLLAQYKLASSAPAQLDEISSELASRYRDKSIVAQYKAAKDGDIATKEKRKAGHLNANKRIKSLPLSAYGDEIQKRDYSGKPGSRTGD